jgi:hypothetical protein
MISWIGVLVIVGGLFIAYDYYDKQQKDKK